MNGANPPLPGSISLPTARCLETWKFLPRGSMWSGKLQHVQQLVDNGETVLSLALDGSPVIDQYSTFASKESSNEAEWPKLVADFDETMATTTTDEPLITTTVEPDTTTTTVDDTTTTTVDLSAFPSVTPTNMPSSKSSGAPSLVPSTGPFAEPTPPLVQQCATAVEDTYIRENSANNNYSGDDRLDTKAVQGDLRRAFVKFDVSGITSPVTSAALRLFCYTEGLFKRVQTSIYALDTNCWDASQVTWDVQQASMTETALATEASPEVRGQSVDLDLTSYINSNLEATELSFAIVAESGDSVYKYYSMDATDGLKPLLVIDSLVECPDPPTSGSVPFDLAKFQPALNTARLQYPESSPTAVDAGQFAGYSSDGFQLVDDQYIQFHISSSEGARSELRHSSEFASSDAVERGIQARMKIPQPDGSLVTQFTFLQVHTKDFLGNPSGPLLRIVWFNSRNGNADCLWANIRKSLNPESNEYFPLQARPNDFFDIEVRVVNSTLSILIDGSYPNPVYNAYNLSYWDLIQTNYFKAGAYLNSGSTGPVVTLFDELTFTASIDCGQYIVQSFVNVKCKPFMRTSSF